jgi:hypothetical protein
MVALYGLTEVGPFRFVPVPAKGETQIPYGNDNKKN